MIRRVHSRPSVLPPNDIRSELPAGLTDCCLTHALVIGGTAKWRRQVAEAIHQRSPLKFAPVVQIDGRRDDSWLIRAMCDRSDSGEMLERAIAATTGTLFVDRIDELSPQSQAMLIDAATGNHDTHDRWNWRPGRLIAGTSDDPTLAVRRGLLSASLYDALDKIRIESPITKRRPRTRWASRYAPAARAGLDLHIRPVDCAPIPPWPATRGRC